MNLILNYGRDSSVTLDFAPDAVVTECGQPSGVSLDDPAAAVAAALTDPLDFPPLSQAIVTGDRIAVAIGDGVPQAAALVAGVVQTLCEAGVTPNLITIVRSPQDAQADAPDPRSGLSDDLREIVTLATHDATERDALSYLAAASDGKPIYVNRVLHDADVVLPIGCMRVDDAVAYHGMFSGLFPTFSDTETIRRYCAPISEDSPVQRRRRREEADEAGWLLGVAISIQVVPGAGDTVMSVLAGAVEETYRRGCQLCDMAWHYEVPQRASLVVAGIEGDASCQTWQNVARAVSSALAAVADGGAIAICSELSTAPGAALQQLAGADDFEAVLREVLRQRSEDAVAATQLLRAMERNRIYLLSDLDDDVVEQIGLAPIDDVADLARLSRRHDSCLVLANAQYAVPKMADDLASPSGG